MLIILGVFIYNLRLPGRAVKKEVDEEEAGNKLQRKEEAKKEKVKAGNRYRRKIEGSVISGLRGLLESQTYEMSGSEEVAARKVHGASNSKTRLASRLVGKKLTGKWTGSHKDDSRGSEGSFEDMLEEQELVGGAKEGQAKGLSSSSGSETASRSRYGSVEKHPSPPRTTNAEISGSSLLESTP